MKKLLSVVMTASLLGLSSVALALDFTFEDAQNTYRARGTEGEGLKNSEKAASMFGELYKEAVEQGKDVVTQSEILIAQAKALYYFADHVKNNEEKKSGHRKGWDLGIEAAKLLHVPGKPTEPKDPNYSRTLAMAYYWQGANMGKWGLANGILNSLRQWPELRETMGYIEKLGEKDVEYFGGNRILGWAYFKLPFPLGDKSKALELLEEACDQTLDSNGNISIHSTNVVYYAQILAAKGKEAKAKDILKKFIQVGSSEESLKEYNEDRIPETLEEIEEAKKILERL